MAASQESIVEAAAKKHGVPPSILWGVYGVETSHGSNISTSSAGAKGAFQFIESTAKSYGYPYTNEHTEKVFAAQADVAAKYLADLYREHGSWDSALKAYSGGGYGYSQVAAQGKIPKSGGGELFPGESVVAGVDSLLGVPSPKEVFGAGESVVGTGESAVNTVGSAVSGTAEVVKALAEPETWLRVAEAVGGMVLFAMGLKTLTRGSGTAGPLAEVSRQARGAGGVVKKGAEVAGAAAVL
jgi:hypothetical protein